MAHCNMQALSDMTRNTHVEHRHNDRDREHERRLSRHEEGLDGQCALGHGERAGIGGRFGHSSILVADASSFGQRIAGVNYFFHRIASSDLLPATSRCLTVLVMPSTDVVAAWRSHATLRRQAGGDSEFPTPI